MKAKLLISGIVFTILLFLIPTQSSSQTILGSLQPKDKKCYFCADSIEYIGLVKLYTNYNAQIEINKDLKLRFDYLDKTYLETRSSLNEALNRLEATNSSLDSVQRLNKLYEFRVNKLETQKKSWRIFGITTSISLVGVVTLLVLTR